MEILQAFLAIVLAGGLMALGVVLGRRLLSSREWSAPPPLELLPDPVPAGWAALVRRHVTLAEQLRPDDFQRLLKLTQLFLARKRMEGAGGLVLTEEMAVAIAAQACLPILWLDIAPYPELRTVIVYPETMVRPDHADIVDPTVFYDDWEIDWDADGPETLLGESWDHGVVLLSWESVRHGSWDRRDGVNVVLHEFAHQLDQEAGAADGMPVGLSLGRLRSWAEVMERRFHELRHDHREGRDTVMDPYGATNYAEFFAVATETFFEKPHQLRDAYPDLYELLTGFYRVDPARGFVPLDPGPAGREVARD